jgi:hypothetical protein
MSEPTVPDQPVNPEAQPVVAERAYLSPAPIDPKTGRPDHTQLKPHQAALRQAVVDAFNAKKARKFLQKHVHHISIKFLFDEHGRPPPNAPLEDIVEERQKIEYEILWVEGVLLELRHRLIKVKEVEDYALEMLSRASPED